MPGQTSKDNGKKGGRPKGSLNQATLEKKEIEKQFGQRVLNAVDRLFNAQMSIAEGTSYLYRIDEEGEGKNKKRKHVLVTSPEEIRAYLDDEVDQDSWQQSRTAAMLLIISCDDIDFINCVAMIGFNFLTYTGEGIGLAGNVNRNLFIHT